MFSLFSKDAELLKKTDMETVSMRLKVANHLSIMINQVILMSNRLLLIALLKYTGRVS